MMEGTKDDKKIEGDDDGRLERFASLISMDQNDFFQRLKESEKENKVLIHVMIVRNHNAIGHQPIWESSYVYPALAFIVALASTLAL